MSRTKPSIKTVQSSWEAGEDFRVPCIVTGHPKPKMVLVDDRGNNLTVVNVGTVCFISFTINNRIDKDKCPL